MSTATTNTPPKQLAWRGTPTFWRFAWKELRMIRGLWLAVAILAFGIQVLERMLLVRSQGLTDTDLPAILFWTSLTAAILYTAGAAATTFSVEHEEETYDFLVRLPATWPALFAAKLLVTFVTAAFLAAVLLIPVWLMRGSSPLNASSLYAPFHVLGIGIVEALAWGTLFSLLIKRPLLAAIVTLVITTLATTMAVNFVSHDTMASLNVNAYAQAFAFRTGIAAIVLASSALVASRWLTVGARPLVSGQAQVRDRLAALLSKLDTWTRFYPRSAVHGASAKSMLARLLWQTWRESWKLLCVPVGLAALLFAGLGAVLGLTHAYEEVILYVMTGALLFAPAIYGAMAFYIDQRRGSYRFLAEHAARARSIWLARHIVWLGTLVAIWLLLVIGLGSSIWGSWSHHEFNSRQIYENYSAFSAIPNSATELYQISSGAELVGRALLAGSLAVLVVYGIGQFFSMAIRSEILAGFLSLLLAFVVGGWIFVVCLWHLSPWWFMLPIFLGLMLTTWFRAPDWIAERNNLRAWWKPALAALVPILAVGGTLPSTRLAQMRPIVPKNKELGVQERQRAFDSQLAGFKAADSTEASRTADMYIQVAVNLRDSLSTDLLKPWRKEEYSLPLSDDRPPTDEIGDEIDESKLPVDEWPAFRKTKQDQKALMEKAYQTAIEEATKISKRPTCRFHVDPTAILMAARQHNRRAPDLDDSPPSPTISYKYVASLVYDVAGMSIQDKQPLSVDRFEAALRMLQHLRSGQPTGIAIELFELEKRMILWQISSWAQDNHRTKEELREALDRLTPILLHSRFKSQIPVEEDGGAGAVADVQIVESPADALLADHAIILNVIDGKEPPFIVAANASTSTSPSNKKPQNVPTMVPQMYLAYLANEIPWERDRARLALERITRSNLYDAQRLTDRLQNTVPWDRGSVALRELLRPTFSRLPERWEVFNPQAVTSYLVSFEYAARVPASLLNKIYYDTVTCRRGTLLQIALAFYRLDHKEYPQRLADLVPKYLEQMPLDPYSQQPFQYEPNGLGLPLSRIYPYQHTSPNNIETNRPFFWSVGAANVRLKEDATLGADESQDAPTPPGENPPQKTYRFYKFFDTEQSGWEEPYNFVFPLPI